MALPPSLPPVLASSVTAVRTVHVLAAAVSVGGALLVTTTMRQASTPTDRRSALRVATAYEYLLWGALGLLAATGVGNLGVLAPSIPSGAWGVTLTAKLLVVLVVLVGSLVRTLAVVRCRTRGGASVGALGPAYLLTTVALGTAVVLAEVLAHG